MARPNHRSQALLQLLQNGTEATVAELAEQLDCSERQVRRLIEQLRAAGLSLEERWGGRKKLFLLAEAHRAVQLQSVALEEQELLALTLAAEAMRAMLHPTPFGLPLQRAIRKLLEHTDDTLWFDKETEAQHWHFSTGAVPRIDPDVLATLRAAIADQEQVQIDYVTANTGKVSRHRRIDPLRIAVQGTVWMVVAWCHQKRQVRDFALSGITRLETTGQYFSPPVGFDPQAHLAGRFRALAGTRLHQIRLRVEPDRAEYFRRTQYHPSQKLATQHDDGSLDVTFEATNLQEVRAFVQSWGTGVTALAPPELVAIMAAEAAVLAERYGNREQNSDT